MICFIRGQHAYLLILGEFKMTSKNVSNADSRTASVATGLGSMLDSTTRTSDLESFDPSPFVVTLCFFMRAAEKPEAHT